MKKALVTGGAGFLGSTIVKELLQEGVVVRILALPGEPLDNIKGLDVEVVQGNVMSPDDATRAVEGVDTVFHAAAIYKDYMADPRPMYEVNLSGTVHVLEAARRAAVERVVYTASIVALGRPAPGQLGNEEVPYEAWDVDFPYSRSKWLSMMLALDFAKWGLDVRVVCPGVVFGPGDIGPTPSGKLIINVASGKAGSGYTDGGSSYVDVRDAAHVHILAAHKGQPGQKYIATAHNLDNRQFIQAIGRVSGRTPTLRKMPVWIVRPLIGLMARSAIRSGKDPMMTRAFFDYSVRPSFFDNRKSVAELGATYRPIEDSIRDAVEYFVGRGLLQRP